MHYKLMVWETRALDITPRVTPIDCNGVETRK